MAAISPIASASDIQMDYMKLLITQMRNQNPMEPMDNSDMASQLAQFSQLQQLEKMNSNFDAVNSNFAKTLDAANRSYANSLIGKEVSFATEAEDKSLKAVSGTVKEVYNDPEKGLLLSVESDDGTDYTMSLNAILSVKDKI